MCLMYIKVIIFGSESLNVMCLCRFYTLISLGILIYFCEPRFWFFSLHMLSNLFLSNKEFFCRFFFMLMRKMSIRKEFNRNCFDKFWVLASNQFGWPYNTKLNAYTRPICLYRDKGMTWSRLKINVDRSVLSMARQCERDTYVICSYIAFTKNN